jgi:hypothetical protein
MKTVRAKFRRQYLYVFECETPYGFTYRGYSNSIEYPPGNWTGDFKVNLKK